MLDRSIPFYTIIMRPKKCDRIRLSKMDRELRKTFSGAFFVTK